MKATVIVALVLCLQGAFAAESARLTFESLRGIVPGSTTQKQVLKKFGRADKTIDLKTLQGSTDSGISWEYREGGGTRLSIAFDGPGQIASGWTWTVSNKDPEKDLKTALSRFDGASWETETVKWVNPHQVPMECFFRDNAHGISSNNVHKLILVPQLSPGDLAEPPNKVPDWFAAILTRGYLMEKSSDGILRLSPARFIGRTHEISCHPVKLDTSFCFYHSPKVTYRECRGPIRPELKYLSSKRTSS